MKSDRLTLNQCSKADLIWIINRLLDRFCFPNGKYQLSHVLSDLQYKKEHERYDEADKIAKLADAKRREYLAILEPYDGKRLLDIPIDVLEKADAAMKEAQEADKRWNKLMGI